MFELSWYTSSCPFFSLETHFGFKVNFVKIFPRLDAGMLLLNGAPNFKPTLPIAFPVFTV
jgi:hypothetical protein